MLRNSQKTLLKKFAHQNEIVKINIGKETVDNATIQNISNCFNTHELVKIAFLKSCLDQKSKHEVILDLMSKMKDCELVQSIGNTIILYKQNTKLQNHIVLK